MLSASSTFISLIRAGARQYTKATLLLADGTTMALTEDDFIYGSIVYAGGTSSSGKFDVGGCVIKSFKFSLNNFDGKFDDVAWAGMRIQPYFGVEISSGNFEWVNPDIFYLVKHKTTGNVISCEAYDGLVLLDQGTITVQAGQTALGAVTQCLTAHGLTASSSNWSGYNWTLCEAKEMTHRQCLAYIMQLTGNIAVMKNGALRIFRYAANTSVEADIHSVFSSSMHTENLALTGVRYTSEDGSTYSRGTVDGDGAFVYEIKEGDNPFAPHSERDKIVQQIWYLISNGRGYRPGQFDILADPRIEAGDRLRIFTESSASGPSVKILVTNFEYKPASKMSVSFDAEERSVNDLRQVNLNHAIYEAKKYTDNTMSTYEAAYNQFQTLISETMGLFFTKEVQQDGSTILYMHDKQTKAQSQTIWKMTANTLSVSTDGGQTYNAAVNSQGNLITNVLYAIKVSADVIEGGLITDATGKNTWNLDTGVITLQKGIIKDAAGKNEWNMQTGSLKLSGEFSTNYYNTTTNGKWTVIKDGTISSGYNENGTIDIVAKSTLSLAEKMSGYEVDGSQYSNIPGMSIDTELLRLNTGMVELVSNGYYVCRINANGINNRISLAAELNMGNQYIRNPGFVFGSYGEMNPDYGVTATVSFKAPKNISSSGLVTSHSDATLTFKNGILISSSI